MEPGAEPAGSITYGPGRGTSLEVAAGCWSGLLSEEDEPPHVYLPGTRSACTPLFEPALLGAGGKVAGRLVHPIRHLARRPRD